MTRAGARSRSRCAPQRDFRLSASTRKQATTRPASSFPDLSALSRHPVSVLDPASFRLSLGDLSKELCALMTSKQVPSVRLLFSVLVIKLSGSTSQANTAHKVFKARVRAERIESRAE